MRLWLKKKNTETVSPVDVSDSIIHQAKGSPLVLRVFIHIYVMNTVFILLNAEKTADVTEFVMALKLCSIFITLGHATGYSSLIASKVCNFYTMSNMGTKIWSLSLFWKGVYNKNIFGDLFVEKYVVCNRLIHERSRYFFKGWHTS